MNIHAIVEVLNKEHGTDISCGYYRRIEEWRQWWAGHAKGFHRYRELGEDGRRRERELYSMQMAKKLCEDWAAILLNEKVRVGISDQAAAQFLTGEDGNGGVLQATGFWAEANRLVEKAFYSGTGAFVMELDGLKTLDGRVLKSPDAQIRMEYLPAGCIVPISSRYGQVTEAAFVSEGRQRGRRQVYVEQHLLENGRYVIVNRCYEWRGGQLKACALPDGVAERVDTGCPTPFFAMVKPNTVNPYPENLGLGCAVFAQAIDCLKGVDLAFNNFLRDFRLGGKKVFYNRSLTKTVGSDGNGNPVFIAPDDMMQQLFVSVGDEFSDDAKLIHEFNPSLRVEDNRDGVQAQLDYLSFKCGLGTKHYQFNNAAVVTATQYSGERQELRQNAAKHGIVLQQALQQILRAMLWAGRHVLGLALDDETPIRVLLPDGYLTSDEEKRALDRLDVQDGILQKWEYRMRWYGEDAAQARERLGEESVPTKA